VLWLSIGGLAVYAVAALGWSFSPTWIGTLEYQVVGSLVLFGPAAIAGILSTGHRRLRRRQRPSYQAVDATHS
jgi:hypothetical protein